MKRHLLSYDNSEERTMKNNKDSKIGHLTCNSEERSLMLKPCLQFDVNVKEQHLMATELKKSFSVEKAVENGSTALLLRSLVWELICLIEKREERRKILFTNLCLSLYNYLGKQSLNLNLMENSLTSLEPSQHKFRSTLKELILRVNANVRSGENLDFSSLNKQGSLFMSHLAPKLLLENELSSVIEKTSLFESSRYNKEFVNLGVIEQGGFGTVCKVTHLVDGCMYALKIIPFRYNNLVTFQKIMNEVKIFANISTHPNIIQYKTSWLEEVIFERPTNNAIRARFEALDEETEDSDKYVIFESSDDRDAKNTLKLVNREHSVESEVTHSFESTRKSDVVATTNVKFKNNGAVLYIQMELCDKNLKTWIQERNSHIFASLKNRKIFEFIDIEEPLRIFRDILAGIDYIHDKNLIHRDIKPQNILFSFDGTVKIADFGLSTFDFSHDCNSAIPTRLSASSENFIEHTVGLGTGVYAAPEQKSSSHYDKKVDIYSLGFVLLELMYPFATNMEKSVCFENLTKRRTVPEYLQNSWPNISRTILEMTSPSPSLRPDAKHVLDSMNYINKEQKLIVELQHKVQCLTTQLMEKDKEIKLLRDAIHRNRSNGNEETNSVNVCEICSREILKM